MFQQTSLARPAEPTRSLWPLISASQRPRCGQWRSIWGIQNPKSKGFQGIWKTNDGCVFEDVWSHITPHGWFGGCPPVLDTATMNRGMAVESWWIRFDLISLYWWYWWIWLLASWHSLDPARLALPPFFQGLDPQNWWVASASPPLASLVPKRIRSSQVGLGINSALKIHCQRMRHTELYNHFFGRSRFLQCIAELEFSTITGWRDFREFLSFRRYLQMWFSLPLSHFFLAKKLGSVLVVVGDMVCLKIGTPQ